MSLPIPPPHLTTRTGGRHEDYENNAHWNRQRIEGLLPEGWSFEGKRVLDFGCGAGRSLAVFADHAEHTELVGCDLHAESIEWAQKNLSPPFEFLLNDADPPIDQPSSSFDLIFGVSAFTHVTENWAPWMQEMCRLLKPGGLAVFSFLGQKMWGHELKRDWDPDSVGMVISYPHRPWDHGGPDAFHGEWWLRAHWGRAFEILHLDHGRPDEVGHGWVVMRRDERPVPTVEALEAPEPGEVREVLSGRTNVALLCDQLRDLYADRTRLETALHATQAELADTQRDRELAWRRFESVVKSKSWAMTRPVRELGKRVRRD
jgi:SAM-dependent methyltransferase